MSRLCERSHHIIPLACGEPDDPANLQWQTMGEAKVKDKWELLDCAAVNEERSFEAGGLPTYNDPGGIVISGGGRAR
jgi:hypothetical protein